MQFKEVIGNEHIKQKLIETAQSGRTSHAQLFIGKEGFGGLAMALAYAQYLNCHQPDNTDSCGSCPSCLQYKKLAHPDLHFIFPTVSDSTKKKEALSDQYLEEWRHFVNEQTYSDLNEWVQTLDVGNKQMRILKKESEEISRQLALKTFSDGYRVIIIWQAHMMNADAANKLLKSIEEPPEKTLFFLIANDPEQVLPTIMSRTQIVSMKPVLPNEMIEGLMRQFDLDQASATNITEHSEGNVAKAIQMAQQGGNQIDYQNQFVQWIRDCFKADLLSLVPWTDNTAKQGREKQKQFLQYASNMFRQALMQNYQVDALVNTNKQIGDFHLDKFAPFVHSANIIQIMEDLGTAQYHIERNANPKLVFLDLSIHMTRHLRAKEQAS